MTKWLDGIEQIGSSAQLNTIQREATETEKHFHNQELWLGNAGNASTLTPITLASGDAAFGDWVLASPGGSQPYVVGNTHMDGHRVFIKEASTGTPFRIRGSAGITGGASGFYTEFMAESETIGNRTFGGPVDFMSDRVASGTSVWLSCKNVLDASTISLFMGIHEYVPIIGD